MNVEDVMSREVITVGPEASIHTAAQLMVDHGVSGLPVLDQDGRLVGVISEGDLIVRQKPRAWPKWWHLFFRDGERLAREYLKAMGITVAEVMTASVICVRPDAPLGSAAALLDEHRIGRLPVVAADGSLVGIVSRGDLIKALAATVSPGGRPLTDTQLVGEMRRRLSHEPWVSSRNIIIEARDGVISLWGMVESEAEKAGIETMARSIPGCRGLEHGLVVRPHVLFRHGAV